jgi:DNA (cytosine-5)-methyltransferase 1
VSKNISVASPDCRGLVTSSRDVAPERGVAISLFSGAGGLDLGAEQAGYRVHAAVEYNNDAADTMEKNFPDLRSPVIRQNILEVPSAQIREAAGLGQKEQPELLIGGPPCTPFSKSSFWLDWKREGLDPNASLLQEYTRVLRDLRPQYFVLENVYALTYNNRQSRPHFERLLREIDEYGYDCNWEVLNAANFGVPQARPRLVIVGAPKGSRTPALPKPTHGGRWERQDVGKSDSPHVTAGEALDGLHTAPEPADPVAGQYGHLLPGIPPGGNYLHYTAERGHPDPLFKWRSRYWSFLLKLDPAKPAPTIQAQPGPYVGPFHWENRRLRVAELKRLFTFPDNFELVGSRNSIQAQLGNSVPPLLAKTVIAALTEQG